jgi:hypothetical protein
MFLWKHEMLSERSFVGTMDRNFVPILPIRLEESPNLADLARHPSGNRFQIQNSKSGGLDAEDGGTAHGDGQRMGPLPYMAMEPVLYAPTFVRWVEGVAMAKMGQREPDLALR